jgi:hypothetical protein
MVGTTCLHAGVRYGTQAWQSHEMYSTCYRKSPKTKAEIATPPAFAEAATRRQARFAGVKELIVMAHNDKREAPCLT